MKPTWYTFYTSRVPKFFWKTVKSLFSNDGGPNSYGAHFRPESHESLLWIRTQKCRISSPHLVLDMEQTACERTTRASNSSYNWLLETWVQFKRKLHASGDMRQNHGMTNDFLKSRSTQHATNLFYLFLSPLAVWFVMIIWQCKIRILEFPTQLFEFAFH